MTEDKTVDISVKNLARVHQRNRELQARVNELEQRERSAIEDDYITGSFKLSDDFKAMIAQEVLLKQPVIRLDRIDNCMKMFFVDGKTFTVTWA